MSDLMLLGVLRMPIDPNSGPVALTQFFARAREAADRIESDAAEIERLRAALAQPPAPTAQQKAKSDRVHALVNAGPLPGMSEAFDAHMGAACWTDPAYAPDASMWAAAWKAAQPVQQPGAEPVACWGVEACVNGAWTLQWPPRMTREVAWADRNAYIPNTLLRVRPLYFGAAPAQRQPLSEVQIHAMKCAAADQGITGIAPSLHLARAIEAAHGITAAPAAQKGEKL